MGIISITYRLTSINLPMRTIERQEIALNLTDAHPLNREFETRGEAWAEFEDDVAARGIQEDMVVRHAPELNGRYQVLRGHRRRCAGQRRKIARAWCLVVECTDEEAFDHMYGENLFRENVNPADEARAVRVKLEEFGNTVEQLAAQWHRSVEWIRTRQQLLELGDEVLEAVARGGRDRLSMGAVEQILKVPAEFREDAVRLVLHPELELGVLDEGQAREVLRKCLVEPRAKEAAWEAARGKVVKAMRKDLEKLCLKGTKGDLMVSSKGLVEAQGMARGFVAAAEAVPLAQVLPDAPAGLRWVHLAVKHGLAVLIVPGDGAGEAKAVVNQRTLTDAETAMAEHASGGNWLVVGRRRVVGDPLSVVGEEEERVAKAKADVEAGWDTSVDVGEKSEVVIEQGVERCVMMRMGEVERLREWLKSVGVNEDPPEWVPKWLRENHIYYEVAEEVCDWVMGLRV